MSRKQRSSARRAASPGPGRGGPQAPASAGRGGRPASTGSGRTNAARAAQGDPGRARSVRPWLLPAAAGLIVLVSVVAVVLAQGSSRPSGPAAFRSNAPTARPTTVLAAGGSAVSSGVVPSADPAASGYPTLDGVACDPTEGVTYHVHAHLNIRIAGQLETIPGDVGRRDTCLYWLHTHQPLGVIHIEAPTRTDFTVGQFFDVWGKPLDATHVADWAVPAGSRIWVFVDRKQVATDPRAVVLGDLEAIELQVGPAPIDPLPYTFPPDFG